MELWAASLGVHIPRTTESPRQAEKPLKANLLASVSTTVDVDGGGLIE